MTEGGPTASPAPAPGRVRILVVDDVPEICEFYHQASQRSRAPIDLVTETDSERALGLVRHEAFHLVVCDYRLARANGLQILTAARERSPRGYRVLMTGYNEIPAGVAEVRAAGVDAYLQKPLRVAELVGMLNAFATENRVLIRRWQDEAHETEQAGFAPTGEGHGRVR